MHTSFLCWAMREVVNKREPDIYIGGRTNTYMERWYLIPHNRFFNVYLHHFLRSDDDRALHDHPWWNFSWLLKGEYEEVTADMDGVLQMAMSEDDHQFLREERLKPGGKRKVTRRKAGQMALRLAKKAHRIQLLKDAAGREQPVWTLFVTGPKLRVWGFWCREGWVAFDSAARKERRLNPGGRDGPCPN